MKNWFLITFPDSRTMRIYSPSGWAGLISYTQRLPQHLYNGTTIRALSKFEGWKSWLRRCFSRRGYVILKK